MSITVFLADDHAVVREGLRFLLEKQGDIKVIGDAANGREVVTHAMQCRPHIAIIDIAMPELNGIEAARQVRETSPTTQVIIFSMYFTPEHLYRAFQAGVRGYLLKESVGAEVVTAVRAVHAGSIYLSRKIADIVIEGYVRQHEASGANNALSRLSPSERQILQLVAEGKTSAEISDILHLSRKTVETYRSHLMQKLGISDLAGLIKFAIQHGLTSL